MVITKARLGGGSSGTNGGVIGLESPEAEDGWLPVERVSPKKRSFSISSKPLCLAYKGRN